MAEKDYYLILGVGRTETLQGIQKAFRELAKRYHPDHAGPQNAEAFREILEAYRVLSDAESRRVYTEKLQHAEQQENAGEDAGFAPYDPPPPPWPEPMSSGAAVRGGWPFQDSLWSYGLGSIVGREHAAYSVPHHLSADVYLSTVEATYGTEVRLEIPLPTVCPWCRGRGQRLRFRCPTCGGRGGIGYGRPVTVRIPAGIPPGTVVEVPLHQLGLPNVSLQLCIRLAAWL